MNFIPRLLAQAYGASSVFRKRSIAAAAALGVAAFAAQPAQALTLLALGDSLTQGYGLPQEDGFVPQLEGWLAEQGREVTVINAGVSGDTTAGGLARIEWALAEEPDALIVALGGNDLLRGLDPASSRENLEGILKVADSRDLPVLVVGLPAPSNYGPDFKRAFESMYPELAEEYGALHYANMLAPMAEKAEAGASFAELMQSDHIHPNAEGVALIVDAIGPAVLELLDQAGRD